MMVGCDFHHWDETVKQSWTPGYVSRPLAWESLPTLSLQLNFVQSCELAAELNRVNYEHEETLQAGLGMSV